MRVDRRKVHPGDSLISVAITNSVSAALGDSLPPGRYRARVDAGPQSRNGLDAGTVEPRRPGT